MLFKVDYTKRSDHETHSKFVDFVADEVEAAKRFMDEFFVRFPSDAVRIERLTKVEIIGDVPADLIDTSWKEPSHE